MENRADITRRKFIAGTGVLTAAIAGLGISACTPGGTNSGGAGSPTPGEGPAVPQNGRWSWSVAPTPIEDKLISKTLECDVLILGCGSTGIAASTYASSTGAKTIVMTKGPSYEKLGFNVGAWNSKYDADYGIEYNPSAWRRKFTEAYDGKCNVAMLGKLFDESGVALDWLAEYMNDLIPYTRTTDTGLMMSPAQANNIVYVWEDLKAAPEGGMEAMEPGMSRFFEACIARTEENGGQFLFSTPAVQLLVDADNRVVGAVGRRDDGSYVKVTATKGVLLGTGDIVHDEEMLECFCPQMAGGDNRNAFGTCTGDGIRMASWIGARTETAPWCISQAYPHGDNIAYGPDAPVVNWFFAGFPWLRVNKAGRRFVNETIGRDELFGSSTLMLANSDQPDQTCFALCDSNFRTLADPDPRGLTALFEAQAAAGIIKQADSLEGLAEKIGVDPSIMAATAKRYNSFCVGGNDLDYGVEPDGLCPLEKPPFYALEFRVYNTCAVGGLMSDEFLQVVDKACRPIEGLYAAGNCLGGRAGFLYLDSLVGAGSMKTTAMAGGILAIRNMLGTSLDVPN